jgi:aminopeptidase N
VVGNNAYQFGWLDEGLTEYTTALFYEFNDTYEIKKEEVIENALTSYNMFQQVYEQIFGSIDTTLTRTLGEYRTEPEYVYMAYVKAMLLFNELRTTIGDKAFFKAIKQYYNENQFQNVTPEMLITSFEKSTKRNLKSWFSSWIDGKVIIKQLN